MIARVGRLLAFIAVFIPKPWDALVGELGALLASGDDEGLAEMEEALAAMPGAAQIDAERAAVLAAELASRARARRGAV